MAPFVPLIKGSFLSLESAVLLFGFMCVWARGSFGNVMVKLPLTPGHAIPAYVFLGASV